MHNMRKNLAAIYSPQWVASKTDAQIIAIHKRLQRRGTIKV